ncbi:hypothetical protein HMPREF9694_00107 [Klebsiella michiganensis]|nr:hypothetical protein HMPREF9694_00107 [Klebsiella michiganensis]
METIPRIQHDTDLLRTITKPLHDIEKSFTSWRQNVTKC